jgi:ATP-dependent DNA ligase
MAKILFPPTPYGRTDPKRLQSLDDSGEWVAQYKYNGTHVVVHITPEREVSIFTRHGTPPKLFSLSRSHREQILALNFEKGKEYWLAGELLDHKTTSKEYKKKIVFFDVLHAGRYLMRWPNQMGRLEILHSICQPDPSNLEPANGIALQISSNIWIAQVWETNFVAHFQKFLHLNEIEGLVLRKRLSAIDGFGGNEYEVSWLLRCRKPHAGGNYSF